MAKRKLTKNQSRRLKNNHSARIARAKNKNIDADEHETGLGPEREAIVVAVFGQHVDIEDPEIGLLNRCHVRATINNIVAGDQVIWQQGNDSAVVVSVKERKSLLQRPDSYGNLKVVAANLDQIFITIAPEPEPFANLIDRYLVIAELNDIDVVIVLNKADLLQEFKRDALLKLTHSYQKLGYHVINVSAHTADGLSELETTLTDKTSIFVGQSGVGKSSLVKALIPSIDIRIGDLSNAAAKGRHTTTHSELFHFPKGGSFIDSPGIREFGLWNIDKEDVIKGFKEIYQHSDDCKFRNCSHNKEPGCAIQQAIKKQLISSSRFESYKRILASLDEVEIKSKHLR